MLLPSLLLLFAAAPGPPTIVMARFAGEGMAERDVSAARARVEEELELMGGKAVGLEASVESACFDDPACIATATGESAAALHVELVRVGPLLQVTARLFAPDGSLLYETDRSVNAEGIAATSTLLGAGFAPHIRALAAPQPAPTPAPVTSAPAATSGPLFIPLLAGGGAIGAVGALVLVGGGVLAIERTLVAYTPTTPGAEKSDALTVAPWAAGAAGAGAVVVALGVSLVAAAFVLE